MRTKRCKVCGAIIYDEYAGDICDVCLDEREENDENENQDTNDVE